MGYWENRKIKKQAKLLLKTARRLHGKNRRRVTEGAAAELKDGMAALEDALKSNHPPDIRRSAEKLNEAFKRHLDFARKSVFREYAESFIFALILALLIRTFVVQLFKIPTGSMEPTLLGAQNYGFGDHIVVNKFIYGPQTIDWIGVPWTYWGFEIPTWRLDRLAIRKPQRGDIIVFKFPFNYHCNSCGADFNLAKNRERACPDCGSGDVEYQNKDFVKRCIGLPGESVEIRDGKIYINGGVVGEPESISNIHYTNIHPSRGPYGHPGQKFRVPHNSYFALGDNSPHSRDSRYWGFVPFENIRGNAFFIYLPPSRIGLIH